MEKKNGLCLAGGGVKGASHIGAIKALEENNITFEYVGGTSSRKHCSMLICNGIFSR
ncbi:MAG: hypothetical protein HFJ33_03205 [Clostridia bacterium]|nr:hypothetical protein [Clostridia bacterium]